MIRRLIAGALREAWYIVQTLVMYAQFVLSLPRSAQQLVRAWPEGGIPLGPRVALFVHFDRRGQVRPYVLRYVEMLRRAGLSVVFVTNAGRLRDDGVEALKPLCAGILIRRNVGYDFGAWREALDYLKLPRYETESVLILNDSVYGPLAPLESLLERMDFTKADVWGATDSWQTRYHLQSYFFAVGRKALVSRAWHDFWRSVRPVKSKEWVIRRYEVGLTQSLMRAGFTCAALWNYTELLRRLDPTLAGIPAEAKEGEDPRVDARRSHWGRIMFGVVSRRPLNPTSDLWRQLLQAGYPFLKRQLLRENPSGVLDIADWRDELARMKLKNVPPSTHNAEAWLNERKHDIAADTAMIEADLKQTMRGRAP